MDGYKIIDFKNIALTDDGSVTIEGIYNAIDESNKPLIFTNLNIPDNDYSAGTKQKPIFIGLISNIEIDATHNAYATNLGTNRDNKILVLMIQNDDSVSLIIGS